MIRPHIFAFLLVLLAPACFAQEIAFTWDDLPAHSTLPVNTTRVEIADQIIAAMKAVNMPPVYGFINGIRTVQEPNSTAVLDHWRRRLSTRQPHLVAYEPERTHCRRMGGRSRKE